jgi:hypothetical protein
VVKAVLVGTVQAVRSHIVDVDDGAFIVDRDPCSVVEVPVHHSAGTLRKLVIQELIEQHSTEEDGMAALPVERRDNEWCLAVPKHVDESFYGFFVNQGIIHGAEGNSLDGIIEGPE